jgi:hypothetical protein
MDTHNYSIPAQLKSSHTPANAFSLPLLSYLSTPKLQTRENAKEKGPTPPRMLPTYPAP